MDKQIPYKILYSLLFVNFGICFLISLGWMIHFVAKAKDALNQLKYLKQRPIDPENTTRISRIRNNYYKSIIFTFYLVIESAVMVCMLVENVYDVSDTHNHMTSAANCSIARGSYLQLKYEYVLAVILACRRGLVAYALLLFVLIFYYFSQIYRLKERFRYNMGKAKWILLAMIPALTITVASVTPWTILFDWMINGVILQIVFVIGVVYAKKVNNHLEMRQQDLNHVDEADKFTLKRHSRLVKQYKMFIKPIFILGQYLILSKILDEAMKEFVGTIILNQCWVENTFNISLKFKATPYMKKIYDILKLVVSSNIALALLLFTGTLILLNLILICSNINWRKYKSQSTFKASTPLLANYNFLH